MSCRWSPSPPLKVDPEKPRAEAEQIVRIAANVALHEEILGVLPDSELTPYEEILCPDRTPITP